MKKVKILIVEDEVLVGEDIKIQLEELDYEVCQIASRADEALRVIKIHQPDLVLMDINLDGPIDGIEAAKKIKSLYDLPIIYLTDLKDDETFERAKATGPSIYLNKPFNEYELSRHIDLAIHNHSGNITLSGEVAMVMEDYFWIKEDQSYKKIAIQDILWIEADGSYCEIRTISDKHKLSKNMREVNDLLNDLVFIRIHKSYTINIKRVDEIKGSSVVINDQSIPIGKTFLKGFKEKLKLL
ncbi:MAG: response regulator [Cytophagales bacterium]|nr:response regulator [Cytophagales bacterium]